MSLRSAQFDFSLEHITALMKGATREQLDALRRAWALVHYAQQLESDPAAPPLIEVGDTLFHPRLADPQCDNVGPGGLCGGHDPSEPRAAKGA